MKNEEIKAITKHDLSRFLLDYLTTIRKQTKYKTGYILKNLNSLETSINELMQVLDSANQTMRCSALSYFSG